VVLARPCILPNYIKESIGVLIVFNVILRHRGLTAFYGYAKPTSHPLSYSNWCFGSPADRSPVAGRVGLETAPGIGVMARGCEQITLTPLDHEKFRDEGCKALPSAAEDENDHGTVQMMILLFLEAGVGT
jgi:hypothetical protein